MSTYIFAFIEGILTFVSPCLLPMLPVYFFYLAGLEAGENKDKNINKSTLIKNTLGFIAGFTLIFVLLGAAATSIGHFLEDNRVLFGRISGIIIFIFGLYFLGIFKIKLFESEKRIQYNFGKLGFISSILFGMVFAFGWSPCTGPFLGTALILAGNTGTVLEGMLLLLIYSLGIGVPFLIASFIFEKVKETFNALKKYGTAIKIISGIVLMIMGALVFFDILGKLI